MQVLGGKLKGKKLASCALKNVRPAMALVRKSIFDTLKDFIISSNVLDLCAGTGAIGIEALSRGANKVVFVESEKNTTKLIRKNLEICNLQAKVIYGKVPDILFRQVFTNEAFDLVFINPPYGKNRLIQETLETLVTNNIISKNSLVIIESDLKSNFNIPDKLKPYKEKKFGNTKVTILAYSV